MALKKDSKASSPPAEAPMPTIGNVLSAFLDDGICSDLTAGFSGIFLVEAFVCAVFTLRGFSVIQDSIPSL